MIDPNYRSSGPVFISYTHRDGKQVVDFLETYLRSGGIIPWRDQRDLPDGRIETTIEDAMRDGLSGGILVVTQRLAESTFVPEIEVPALLRLSQEPNASFQILNTIRKPDGGGLDANAPDEVLNRQQSSDPLAGMRQYALLPAAEGGQGASSDLETLLSDLLRRRLRNRREELKERGIRIGVQSRPEANAADAARAGRENDLTIRLKQDQESFIPDELSYRCLQQSLPRVVDAIYDADVATVRFEGGCHASLAWALGAALPEARPRLDRFTWVDTRNNAEWTSEPTGQETCRIECCSIDPETGQETLSLAKGPGETPSRDELNALLPREVSNVVVLLATRQEYHPQPLALLAGHLGRAAILVVKVRGQDNVVPPEEGGDLAKRVGTVLRHIASFGKLHLAMAGAVGFLALVARQCNTLSIDVYERSVDASKDLEHYVRVFRAVSGHSRPIAVVFPHGSKPPAVDELINLTPHDVTLYKGEEMVRKRGEGAIRTWPKPERRDAWVRREENLEELSVLEADGVEIPLVRVRQGSIRPVPPETPEKGYIVPRISAAAARRPDFFFPHREVRDERGGIIGCLGFGCFEAVSDEARPFLQYLDSPEEE